MPLQPNPAVIGEWECMECGYIEQGVESQRPIACHECHAPARALEFFPADDEWEKNSDDDVDDLDEGDYETDER